LLEASEAPYILHIWQFGDQRVVKTELYSNLSPRRMFAKKHFATWEEYLRNLTQHRYRVT
jgi:hypothetical protein